jgi:hypothetical protein
MHMWRLGAEAQIGKVWDRIVRVMAICFSNWLERKRHEVPIGT